MKFPLILLSALTALTWAGCAPHPADDGHDHDHGAESHGHAAETAGKEHIDEPGVIALGDEQAAALGLTYETAATGPFASVIRTGGAIEAAPGDRSTVTATTSGIVGFGGRRLTEGTHVVQGSPLLVLGSSGMVGDNYPQQLADARAELAKAEADYARAETLSGNKVVSGADLEAAELAVDVARRKVAVLSENATKGGKNIVAPIGGYVTSLLVGEGDYVAAGQPLATISANRNLVLRADVPQRCLSEVAEVRTANFTMPYDGKSYDLMELGGRLIGSGRAVAAGSPTLPVRFEFDNRVGLTPGSVVEVFLKGAVREGVLTVPLSALTEEQGAHYLYVRLSPGHYRKVPVRLGSSDGVRVEVLAGLAPGEVVVTEGAYYVRLAGMSTAIPHGHSH
ncbi:efflux RND transporter periplasmic adaptor subunit [uncultured Rikenella sp.]|uniref:efflux RND transporter periplasmic adaptor subunit n=1 Tax=uncultured Rikenella sp. TaxID=368003 RepID=UPI002633D915|nr:efflux RND transporter periplasmic adaptor subunit [uncultured Rikenella sp.]